MRRDRGGKRNKILGRGFWIVIGIDRRETREGCYRHLRSLESRNNYDASFINIQMFVHDGQKRIYYLVYGCLRWRETDTSIMKINEEWNSSWEQQIVLDKV